VTQEATGRNPQTPSLPRRILMAVLGIPRPTVRRAARGEEVKAPTEPDA
jgi:hypothetical protein